MSVTRPLLGYVNYLSRSTTVLASPDVVSGSAVGNLVDENLAAVLNLGVGPTKAVTGIFAANLQPTFLYIRFRGKGWRDLTNTKLRLSVNSDLSTPAKDLDIAPQFPSPWPDEMPVRPCLVATWDAVTACPYLGLDFTRTAGEDPLEIAYAYLGERIELVDGAGYRVYGSSIRVQNHSQSVLTGLQGDAKVAGKTRRGAKVKVASKSTANVEGEWYPKFLYSAADRPVVYWWNPAETDGTKLQSQVLLATAGLGQTLEIAHEKFSSHEQDLDLREIL